MGAIDRRERNMLKHILLCAPLVALGTSPSWAQQHEAALRQVELPGAGVNIVLAIPKSPAATVDLGESPDALVVPLIGGKLALTFEDGNKMIETIGALQRPACAFQAEGEDGKLTKPVAVYVVPRRTRIANTLTTAALDMRPPAAHLRKIEVPAVNFTVVYATTRTPITWESDDWSDAIAVYATGHEFIFASDGDIQRMFKDINPSQWPTCVFHVERKGSNPPEAASVYVVLNGDVAGLAQD
jgi:hypothetical protein